MKAIVERIGKAVAALALSKVIIGTLVVMVSCILASSSVYAMQEKELGASECGWISDPTLKCDANVVLDVGNQKLYYAWLEDDMCGTVQIVTAESDLDGNKFQVLYRDKSRGYKEDLKIIFDEYNGEIHYVWTQTDTQGIPQGIEYMEEIYTSIFKLNGNVWMPVNRTKNYLKFHPICGSKQVYQTEDMEFEVKYIHYAKPKIAFNSGSGQLYYAWVKEQVLCDTNPNNRYRVVHDIEIAEMSALCVGWKEEIPYSYTKNGTAEIEDVQLLYETYYNTLHYAWVERNVTLPTVRYEFRTASKPASSNLWIECFQFQSLHSIDNVRFAIDHDQILHYVYYLTNSGVSRRTRSSSNGIGTIVHQTIIPQYEVWTAQKSTTFPYASMTGFQMQHIYRGYPLKLEMDKCKISTVKYYAWSRNNKMYDAEMQPSATSFSKESTWQPGFGSHGTDFVEDVLAVPGYRVYYLYTASYSNSSNNDRQLWLGWKDTPITAGPGQKYKTP